MTDLFVGCSNLATVTNINETFNRCSSDMGILIFLIYPNIVLVAMGQFFKIYRLMLLYT